MAHKNEIVKTAAGWKAFAFNSKAAQVLNGRLRQYEEADFEAEGSEGVFYFQDAQLAFVRAVLLKHGGIE